MKILNQGKKEMIPLTNEENEYYEMQKSLLHMLKKLILLKMMKKEQNIHKGNHKGRDHCHYTGKFGGAAHSICNLRYKISKTFLVVFHNGSTYDYHFIIKQLAKEFDGQLKCLRENTDKHITF